MDRAEVARKIREKERAAGVVQDDPASKVWTNPNAVELTPEQKAWAAETDNGGDAFTLSRGARENQRTRAIEEARASLPEDQRENADAIRGALPAGAPQELRRDPGMLPTTAQMQAAAAGDKPPTIAAPVGQASPAPMQPGPRPVLVPGGWQAHSRTHEAGVPLTPEQLARERGAADALGQANAEGGFAERQKALTEADGAQRYADLQRQHAADQQARSEKLAKDLDAQIQIQKRMDDEARTGEIDPKRVFHNMSTFDKVITGIALVVGGFGAGLGGGPNQAMGVINKRIDDDIAAQEKNLTLKSKAAERQGLLVGKMMDVYGNIDAAKKGAYLTQLNAVGAEVDAKAAAATDPALKAKYLALAAKIDQERTGREVELTKLQQGKLVQSDVYRPAHLVGGPGAGAKVDQDRIVTMPDGSKRIVRSGPEAQALRPKIGAVQNIQDNIDRALNLRKDASALDMANPYSTARKQLEALQAETAQLVTVARGQGAMSKGDQMVADTAIGSMTGLLGNNDDVLRSTSKRWEKQIEREVQAQGGERIETGYTRDARGNIVPTATYQGQAEKPRPNMPEGFKRAGGE